MSGCNNTSSSNNIMKILDIQSSNSSDSNTISKRSRIIRRRWMIFSSIEALLIVGLVAYIIYSCEYRPMFIIVDNYLENCH